MALPLEIASTGSAGTKGTTIVAIKETAQDIGDDTDGNAGEGDAVAAATKPGRGKKKMIVLAAVGGVLLLGGGGAGYMMLGGKPAAAHDGAAAETETADSEGSGEGAGHEAAAPLDVPPMLVNLRSADGAPHFLKVHVMLVPGAKSNVEALKTDLPVLLDAYQPFLRELRPEDLSGSAAVFRIKEELLIRARTTIGADKVKDVLVQDLVQQ